MESCYVKTIYGTFGVEMRAYGQKLVKCCTHTHRHTDTQTHRHTDTQTHRHTDTRVNLSSIDVLSGRLVNDL